MKVIELTEESTIIINGITYSGTFFKQIACPLVNEIVATCVDKSATYDLKWVKRNIKQTK